MTFFEFGKLKIKLISLALITTFFAFSLNVLNPGEIAATAGTSGVLFSLTDSLKTNEISRINHLILIQKSIVLLV